MDQFSNSDLIQVVNNLIEDNKILFQENALLKGNLVEIKADNNNLRNKIEKMMDFLESLKQNRSQVKLSLIDAD